MTTGVRNWEGWHPDPRTTVLGLLERHLPGTAAWAK